MKKIFFMAFFAFFITQAMQQGEYTHRICSIDINWGEPYDYSRLPSTFVFQERTEINNQGGFYIRLTFRVPNLTQQEIINAVNSAGINWAEILFL